MNEKTNGVAELKGESMSGLIGEYKTSEQMCQTERLNTWLNIKVHEDWTNYVTEKFKFPIAFCL